MSYGPQIGHIQETHFLNTIICLEHAMLHPMLHPILNYRLMNSNVHFKVCIVNKLMALLWEAQRSNLGRKARVICKYVTVFRW